MDIDDLLSVVENPTRRRILELLVNEPSNTLRLSKEIGVSQQAVVKNLVMMERSGMVTSYRESSNMGPERTVYVPSARFTLVVDMQGGMFSVRLLPVPEDAGNVSPSEAEAALKRIKEIDEEIEKLEKMRSKLISEREMLSVSLKNTDMNGKTTTAERSD